MGFSLSDTIKLTVDVVAGQTQSFKGFLSGLKTDVGDAEGAFGKFKVAGAGAMDFVSSNATALAAGAGAAIAGFAISAVGDFQDVALKTGELSDALGLSAEDASRWVEVAGDLGIGADTIESSMGKMLKTAGSSPGVFANLGVEIAQAKDGSVDANQTFLNVIDRLNGMKDPAERAAAAQQLLGKQWQDSAELIGLGAEGVKQRLDEVSGAKIISDDQVGQARDFRDALDNVGDAVDEIKLQIAEDLIPALTSALGPITLVVQAFGKLHDAVTTLSDLPIVGWVATGILGPMALGQKAIGALGDAWDSVFGDGGPEISPEVQATTDALWKSVSDGLPSLQQLKDGFDKIESDKLEQAKVRSEGLKDASKLAADQQAALAESADKVNAAMRDQATALEAQVGAARDAAGATLAVDDAQRGFAEAVANSTAVNKDSKSTSDDKAVAVAAERDAMIHAAEAAEAKTVKDGEASGVAATATQKQDAYNSSLLANAHFATPAAKSAIADYIIEANNVPESKATAIRAAIEAGDFDTAQRLLNEASATRTAAIKADATNTAAASAELDAVATKVRTATIQTSIRGSDNRSAIGGTVPPEGTWTGEFGPEFVDRSLGIPKIVPRAESANIRRAAAPVTNINVTVESGDPVKIAAAVQRVQWLQNAGPRGRG